MKSKKSKIVLSVFALILAITTSLAFSPALNMEDVDDVLAYQQLNGASSDKDAMPTECKAKTYCNVGGCMPCTIIIDNETVTLYGLEGTICSKTLYRAIDE